MRCSRCLSIESLPTHRYCRLCRNAAMRERRKFGFDSPDPAKLRARSRVRMAVRRGTLVARECEVCGSAENVEKHHPDYDRPTLVVFACRNCHPLLDELRISVKESDGGSLRSTRLKTRERVWNACE